MLVALRAEGGGWDERGGGKGGRRGEGRGKGEGERGEGGKS